MSRSFDFYEFAGIIVPGTIVLLALLRVFPDARATLADSGIGFGEFGVLIIVAYAAGHLVQGIGNHVEWLWWKIRGVPSHRILKGEFLSSAQQKRLSKVLRDAAIGDPTKASLAESLSTVREVYSVVAAAGHAARVDKFNGNYGLMRGLAAALLVSLAAAALTGKGIILVGALIALLLVALQRMDRFSKCYALELFTQYLLVADKTQE